MHYVFVNCVPIIERATTMETFIHISKGGMEQGHLGAQDSLLEINLEVVKKILLS